VTLCHGLGLQVVAEGVERATQLEFLTHCGPIAVQGYLLAHPVEAAAAPEEAKAAAARARTLLATVQTPPLALVSARRRSAQPL
jgi:sensor c-di-GMP phosphodiesterase-like protein